MTSRIMALRFQGTCSNCGVVVFTNVKAYWDAQVKEITCLDCYAGRIATESGPTASSRDVVTVTSSDELIVPKCGEAGTSARYEYQRRHDQRERNIAHKFGKFSGLVKLLVDDPQSTMAWAKGSEGDRLLAASLLKHLDERAVLLNDRKIPRTNSNIDHIVIAPSGIWNIDAKKYRGQVEYRDVSGWFKTDMRIYVGGRNRTNLVAGLHKQMNVVRKVLGDNEVLIHQVLCFVDAEWKWFAKPFQHDDVWVKWPKNLAGMISEGDTLPARDVLVIANKLAKALPEKTS